MSDSKFGLITTPNDIIAADELLAQFHVGDNVRVSCWLGEGDARKDHVTYGTVKGFSWNSEGTHLTVLVDLFNQADDALHQWDPMDPCGWKLRRL